MEFWPMQSLYENSKIHQDSNFQSGSSLGSVKVHSLTLSYTPGRMQRNSQASFLARNLASPCLDYEPKARVTIVTILQMCCYKCWPRKSQGLDVINLIIFISKTNFKTFKTTIFSLSKKQFTMPQKRTLVMTLTWINKLILSKTCHLNEVCHV